MRRRWWERVTEPIRGAGGYAITGEHLQHVRDAFAFVERTVQRTANPSEYNEAKEILDRGAPPEPEWRKGPPDSVGTWERRRVVVSPHVPWTVKADVSQHKTTGELVWLIDRGDGVIASGPVAMFNHDGFEYRRVED